jgi:Uma2 family endonuclease
MFAYPDIVVVCEPPVFLETDRNTLANPQIVIEVLSPSTEGYDRGFKFAQYRQQSSLREIIFVTQDEVRVERYVRQADDTWVLTTFDKTTTHFAFGTIDVNIPLARIYRGTDLPTA